MENLLVEELARRIEDLSEEEGSFTLERAVQEGGNLYLTTHISDTLFPGKKITAIRYGSERAWVQFAIDPVEGTLNPKEQAELFYSINSKDEFYHAREEYRQRVMNAEARSKKK